MSEGKFPLEWYHAAAIAVIIVGTIVLNRILRWLLNKQLQMESQKSAADQTRIAFLKNAVSLLVWTLASIAVIYTIPAFRGFALKLLTGAGILMVIAGLAAQQAFSNIVSGVFIVVFKPFRVGDLIQVGKDYYGIVEDITLRHTVIRSFENKRVIIPNSIISSETVTNDSIMDSKVCRFMEFGISYDSDADLATSIIQDVVGNHPLFLDVRTAKEKREGQPAVVIRFSGFGDFSVNLKALVWTKDPLDVFRLNSEINREVKRRFDKEGVEIPFPYRTIVYKKDMQPNAKKKPDKK